MARGSMSGPRSMLRACNPYMPVFCSWFEGIKRPSNRSLRAPGIGRRMNLTLLSSCSPPPPPGPYEATSTHNASKPRGRTRRGGCFPHIRKTGSQGRTGLLPAGLSLRPARPPPAHPSHWPGIECGPGSSRCFRPLPHGG